MCLKFSFQRFIQSFKCAIVGIREIIIREQSFRIMILMAIFVTVASFLFGLSTTERAIIFLIITIVLTVELFNSILEEIMDFISPQTDHRAKRIKDGAAGIVLILCLVALVMGILIFLPHLI